MEVTNKVTISEEARFDYGFCVAERKTPLRTWEQALSEVGCDFPALLKKHGYDKRQAYRDAGCVWKLQLELAHGDREKARLGMILAEDAAQEVLRQAYRAAYAESLRTEVSTDYVEPVSAATRAMKDYKSPVTVEDVVVFEGRPEVPARFNRFGRVKAPATPAVPAVTRKAKFVNYQALAFLDEKWEDETPNAVLDGKSMITELEEYIDGHGDRLRNKNCFSCDRYDDTLGVLLKLFLRHDKLTEDGMRYWTVTGVMLAADWSEDDEDGGRIRNWLKSELKDTGETDWVIELRLRQEKEAALNREAEKEYGNDG